MSKPPRSALAFIFIVILLDVLGLSLLLPVTPYIVEQYRSDALSGVLAPISLVAPAYAAGLLSLASAESAAHETRWVTGE